MGAAQYVGRIGALAVALGVGAAIATPVVALAEPDVGPSVTSGTGPDTGGVAADKQGSGDPADSAVRIGAHDDADHSIPAEDSKDDDDLVHSVEPTIGGDADSTDDPSDETDADSSDVGNTPVVEKATAANDVDDNYGQIAPSVTERRTNHPALSTIRAVATPMKPDADAAETVHEAPEESPVGEPQPSHPNVVPRFTPAVAQSIRAVSEEHSNPELDFGAVTTTALSALLVPGGSDTPTGPAESPLLWGLLAFARRHTANSFRSTAGSVAQRMSTGQLLAAAAVNSAPTVRVTVGTPNSTTGVVTGRVTGSDKDRDPLTYGAQPTSANGGTVVINSTTGAFTYTPTAAARHAAASTTATTADKTDTFTATVDDGHGHLVPVTVTVKVSPTNAKPANAAVTGLFTNPNSGKVTGTIVATDADGDDFTLSGPASTSKGTITYDSATDSFAYVPTAAARQAASSPRATALAKTDSFRVTLSDGHGGTTVVTVKVNIAPLNGVNTAPVITDVGVGQPDSTTGVVRGTATATDADRDALTFSGTAKTSNGKVVVNADGTFTYTPTQAARLRARTTAGEDIDTFTVSVTDGIANTSTTVTATISPAKPTVGTPITVGYGPRGVTVSPDGTRVYVANSADDIVSIVDTASNTVVGTINVGRNTNPADVTVAPDGKRLYVALTGDVDGIAVFDTATNTLLTTIVNDGAIPIAIAITPDGSRAYVANQGNHSVSVIDTATNTITSTVQVGEVPFDIVLSKDGSRAYVASIDYDTYVIDTSTNTVTKKIPQSSAVIGLAISPDGSMLYASTSNQITVINPATNTIVGSIYGIAGRPFDIAFSPDGSLAYVTDNSGDAISVIDTAANAVVATLHSGRSTYGIVVGPDGRAWVTDLADHTVTPISLVPAGTNSAPVDGRSTVTGTDTSTGTVTGRVTAADPDGDQLFFSGPTTSSKGGVVTINSDGTFTYTPTAAVRHAAAAVNATAADVTDSLTVTVSDGLGGTLTVPVTLSIVPHNSAPTIGNSTWSTDSGTGVVAGVITASDDDGDALVFTGWERSAKGGTVMINPDGTFTYTPTDSARHQAAAEGAGEADTHDTIYVTVDDQHGGTDFIALSIDVMPKNAAPTAVVTAGDPDPTSGVVRGTVVTSDPDRDYTYAVPQTITTSNGVVIVQGDGTFTYTPNPEARTAAFGTADVDVDTIQFTVRDDHGGTGLVTAQVTISPASAVAGGSTPLNVANGTPLGGVISPTGFYYSLLLLSGDATDRPVQLAIVDPATHAVSLTNSVSGIGAIGSIRTVGPDGTLYISGRKDGTTPESYVLYYNPATGILKVSDPLPGYAIGDIVIAADRTAYATVRRFDQPPSNVSSVWVYDPATDTGRVLTVAGAAAGAVTLDSDGRAYQTTSTDNYSTATVWRYDPTTATFLAGAPIPGYAIAGVAFDDQGLGYLVTASPANPRTTSLWQYDPVAGNHTLLSTQEGSPSYQGVLVGVDNAVTFATGSSGSINVWTTNTVTGQTITIATFAADYLEQISLGPEGTPQALIVGVNEGDRTLWIADATGAFTISRTLTGFTSGTGGPEPLVGPEGNVYIVRSTRPATPSDAVTTMTIYDAASAQFRAMSYSGSVDTAAPPVVAPDGTVFAAFTTAEGTAVWVYHPATGTADVVRQTGRGVGYITVDADSHAYLQFWGGSNSVVEIIAAPNTAAVTP
ncbi:tandem-95 repeat protein [Mycolicibacterium sp. 3033]|nr:tandem-95 repeat protein [Mycolicibacterium aurantiacum]